MLGKPRLLRPGAAQPKDGEIAVNVVKHDASPYADLTASEKTSAPVDGTSRCRCEDCVRTPPKRSCLDYYSVDYPW